MLFYEALDKHYTFAHVVENIKNERIRHDWHNHNTYELLYLLDGTIEYNIEGELYEVNKGDIIMVNCDEFHALKINSQNRYNRMVIEVTGNFLLEFSQKLDLFYFFKVKKMGINNLLPREIVDLYHLDRYFFRLRELDPQTPENELRIKCVLAELFLDISEIYSKYPTLSNPNKKDGVIQKIISYINNNLVGDLSLDILSKEMFISKYYLCHLFKSETGISINQYIIAKRIHHANNLIGGGMSAKEACFKSGFNDYSTFYRAFVKVLGKAPTSNGSVSRKASHHDF